MKLLTLIGAGVAAGYCYKKMKNKKQNSTKSQLDESIKNALFNDGSQPNGNIKDSGDM
ncbi:hypothetical protein [Acinetobacter bohemicus]|uniref:hypothetical protein n=1 Tax=Acinetobacter bohemicus TaxID=1435036 RepID=UPI003FA213FB